MVDSKRFQTHRVDGHAVDGHRVDGHRVDAHQIDGHQFDNQPPPFAPRDLWRDDHALREAVDREGAGGWTETLAGYGQLAGDTLYALASDAHRDRPRLRSHDARGERIDVVEFHPNYHAVMQAAIGHGVAGLSWAQSGPGAHVARAALSYLHYQVEPGSSCPLTMTHAAIPVLAREPALAQWRDKAVAPHYDPRNVPIADKAGVTLGMGMTEKQGGSDVRANTTVATPLQAPGEYTLAGHKWFLSAPMSDGFLVLAQAPGGLTCLLMPRWRPDGTRNAFALVRLKDKLGDWSNASSEIEFNGAWARRIGEEGRGITTILEMVMLTRLDCMLGSAGLMRMALAQAIHHARHRRAFGKPLVQQPLMRNVLVDLALEAEASLALAMRVAAAVDAAPRDPAQAAFARVATAIGKYWICKRAPAFVNEAQECLGGAGYIEESLLPRLYRQAPLNSIWEGSGNIQCLDVLRALAREPAAAAALLAELAPLAGAAGGIGSAEAGVVGGGGLAGVQDVIAWLQVGQSTGGARAPHAGPPGADSRTADEGQARVRVERLAVALQAAALQRARSPLAQDFAAARLAPGRSWAFGTLPAALVRDEWIERALPSG